MSTEKLLYYDFDEYRLDTVNGQLLKDGKPIVLTPKSLEILQFLIQNRGRLLKKKELLDSIWTDTFVEESSLIQHIYMLRKALKRNGKKEAPIETIPKTGYRFVGEVREICEVGSEDGCSIETSLDSTSGNIPDENFRKSPIEITSQINLIESRGFSKHIYSAIGLILLALTVFLTPYFFYSDKPVTSTKVNSIAVLPFQQITGEKEDKLGLGMADILIAELGKMENVQITPTSSIIRYAKNEELNLFEIGSKLQVETVLWGTIQRNQENVRVNYQLYSVSEKRPLFSGKIDEKYTNIFSFQDKISERVFQQLSPKLKNGQETEQNSQYTKNIEAFQLYSRGLFYWNNRTTKGREEAVKYFQEAIEKDPTFVLANAYLADTYALAFYYGETINNISGDDLLLKAKDSAQKSLELDSNCAEAMTALSLVYSSESKDIEAFNLLQKAIEIKPNNITAHQRIGWLFAVEGNLEKAIENTRLALNIDPQAQAPNLSIAYYLILLRQPDEAIIHCRRILEIDPTSKIAKGQMGEALEQKGFYNEAFKKYKEINNGLENNFADIDNIMTLVSLSRIYAKTGENRASKEVLNKVVNSKERDKVLFPISLAYLSLGEKDKAIEFLEKVYHLEGGKILPQLKYNYNLDPIRDNPRFVKLLNQVEKE